MTDTNVERNVAFIEQHERAVAKQALHAVTALHDALALKREIGLPVVPETREAIREAIDELEGMIVSLKLELLRSPHPDQLMLPLEDLSTEEGKREASRGDLAS